MNTHLFGAIFFALICEIAFGQEFLPKEPPGSMQFAGTKCEQGEFAFFKRKDNSIAVYFRDRAVVKSRCYRFLGNDGKEIRIDRQDEINHIEKTPTSVILIEDGCVFHLNGHEITGENGCTVEFQVIYQGGKEILISAFVDFGPKVDSKDQNQKTDAISPPAKSHEKGTDKPSSGNGEPPDNRRLEPDRENGARAGSRNSAPSKTSPANPPPPPAPAKTPPRK